MPAEEISSKSTVIGTTEKSLFARIMEESIRHSDLNISFEDLTGIVLDIPDVKLPYHLRIHTCDFCLHAKSTPVSHQHCVRNKMAANRVALRKHNGYAGQCHLGLTELVKPLIFRDHILGVFYYGSFILAGTEELARSKIMKFCQRHHFEPAGYLLAFEQAPRVSTERLSELWQRLDLVVDLARVTVESAGIPVDRYRTQSGAQFATWSNAMPALVRTVIAFINHHYSSPLRVQDIATIHRCNSDYLSRIFKKTVGLKPNDYIQRVRVDHAKRLLLAKRFTIGEVGFMVGFQDHSHFGKIFRQITGTTPQEFRLSNPKSSDSFESGVFSTFEYSNIHSFNPQFGSTKTNSAKLIL